MKQQLTRSAQWVFLGLAGACLLALFVASHPSRAINALPTPDPKPGSFGVEATKKQAPPSIAPTITTPGNGSSFSTSPITVNGVCQTDLLVQVYNNGVMVGAVICKGNSFSIQVSLFAGANELTAIQYDDLEQASPVSNTITVNYTDTSFTAFGQQITLTSSYGRRAAPAGSTLSWPLQLSGGTGPYAFSIDWGDGSKPQLMSQALAGIATISHDYKKAGIYIVNISVTDVNGVKGFLQVIAVASGKVDSATAAQTGDTPQALSGARILWLPYIILLLLLLPTYWLGRRSMLVSIRNKMLKERAAYENDKIHTSV